MEDNLNGSLELVYENPGTKIYRVKDGVLPALLAATDATPGLS